MKRRSFLKKTAAVAAGTGLVTGCGGTGPAGAGPAVQTQQRVIWRLTSSFPRSLDTMFGVAEFFAERVKAMTDGRFVIMPSPAGELVPGLQVLDAVQQGTVQMGQTASYYYKGKHPALAFDSAIPFGLTARQQIAWLSHAGGLELIREILSDFNIINFPCGNTGMQMGGWFRNEVHSLGDLKGLKMRIPGLGGEVMSRLGVTVQVLAGGDIFPALERGAIDATEWVGPYDDEKLGFYKVAKNYYYPGWWEPGPNLSFLVNKEAWAKLPTAYQQVFEAASAEAQTYMTANYDAKNPPALERLLAQEVKLQPFSHEILEAAQKTTFELTEDLAAGDPSYAKVYNHWKQFRRQSYAWTAVSDGAYAQFAFKVK